MSVSEERPSTVCDGTNSGQVRSDEETPSTATVLVATGDNFESAMATVMYQARSLTVSSTKWTGEHTKEMAALNDSVRRQSHEGWQDGLGFCKQ